MTYNEISVGGCLSSGLTQIQTITTGVGYCLIGIDNNPIVVNGDYIVIPCDIASGINGSGDSNISIIRENIAFGDVLCNGSSISEIIKIGIGVAVVGGSANVQLVANLFAIGDVILAGNSTSITVTEKIATGGVGTDGSILVEFDYLTQGGTVIDGLSIMQYIADPFNACSINSEDDPITSNGEDVYTKCYYGALLGGTANITTNEISTGGVLCGGQAIDEYIREIFEIGSGGIDLGGQAIDEYIREIFEIGSGGVDLGGQAIDEYIEGSGETIFYNQSNLLFKFTHKDKPIYTIHPSGISNAVAAGYDLSQATGIYAPPNMAGMSNFLTPLTGNVAVNVPPITGKKEKSAALRAYEERAKKSPRLEAWRKENSVGITYFKDRN